MKNIETPSNAASDEAPLEKPDEAPGLETVSESEASAVKKSEEECSQTGAQHSAENSAGEVLNFLGELAVEEMPGVFARHTNECSVRCAGNAWRHCQRSGRLFHGLIWGQGRS